MLTGDEKDFVLERWDASEPPMQREIVIDLLTKLVATQTELENLKRSIYRGAGNVGRFLPT